MTKPTFQNHHDEIEHAMREQADGSSLRLVDHAGEAQQVEAPCGLCGSPFTPRHAADWRCVRCYVGDKT